MSQRIQTIIFSVISVLVFLYFTRTPSTEKNENPGNSIFSDEIRLGSPGETEDGKGVAPAIDASEIKEAFDSAKEKLVSVVMNGIENRIERDTDEAIQMLTKIAEDDMGSAVLTPFHKNNSESLQQSSNDIFKCLSGGATGEVPGDRLEIVLPVAKGVTISSSIEGGSFCDGHVKESTMAQYILGIIYYHGMYVPQDYQKALAWHRKAADNGFPLAAHHLGIIYENGEGVTQNYTEAIELYGIAADQGIADAQHNLGEIYYWGKGVDKSYPKALAFYQKAADQGDAMAQYSIGYMYFEGLGVASDNQQSVHWYRKAAEQGHAVAQHSLGVIYEEGYAGKADLAQAVHWYRRAAENGNAPAQTNLGNMFQMGRGLEKNNKTAMKWYNLAAEQGNVEAMAHLGHMYENGIGIGPNKSKAQDLYLAIAQKADANTLLFLGVDWEVKPTVLNDKVMAYMWYRLSAHKGSKSARQNRSFITKKMTAEQISIAEDKSRRIIKTLTDGNPHSL